MGTLLQAQEVALWMESSTMRSYEILLAFAINTKPKVSLTKSNGLYNGWNIRKIILIASR